MPSRRKILHLLMMTTASVGAAGLGPWAGVAAQDRFDQDALLQFDALGNVTLIHVADLQAQLVPAYFRAPEVSIGIGDTQDQVPHLTGEDFRIRYGIGGATPMDYALTFEDFTAHAKAYGKMGGLDRVATVVNAIRTELPDALLLEGRSAPPRRVTLANRPRVTVTAALKPETLTMRGGFGFGSQSQGTETGETNADDQNSQVLGGDIPGLSLYLNFHSVFEREGVKIAVIRQDGRFGGSIELSRNTPDAGFGTHDSHLQNMVDEVRKNGADLVVCLSQNGFDIDRKLAGEVKGIDVILSGRSHLALPEPEKVGGTQIICSGAQGQFVSRVDLDVQNGKVKGLRHKLIPIFADLIAPDPAVRALIDTARAPTLAEMSEVIGTTEVLLYRRGTLAATWDSLICDALLAELDADVALLPAMRWGGAVLPGQDITREAILSVADGLAVERVEMTGEQIKTHLENAADAVFAPDPYDRSAEDMLRVGGMSFKIDIAKDKGQRITDIVNSDSGASLDLTKTYSVARSTFAKASPDLPLAKLVETYIRQLGRVTSVSAPTAVPVLS